ncbi:hypothetical protein LJK88_20825 [Paenibacillus sp. P26]|nr:hypothetical protein LJK88_20825 [Paenibacillus sp. P26]
MKKQSRTAAWLLAGTLMIGGAVPAWGADAPAAANLKTAAQVAADLGMLQGMEPASATLI